MMKLVLLLSIKLWMMLVVMAMRLTWRQQNHYDQLHSNSFINTASLITSITIMITITVCVIINRKRCARQSKATRKAIKCFLTKGERVSGWG